MATRREAETRVTLEELNAASESEARAALERCCGSHAWADRMCALRPFASAGALIEAAVRVWWSADEADWRDAFAHHPRIGDAASLRAKFPTTASWAVAEQAGATEAGKDVLDALASGNREYERRFGYIFIVCASGLGAAEMLSRLRARLANAPEVELRNAAEEQMKITQLRIEKLLAEKS
jgi:2-oxo-4-hydroxy-4-carboxy-5-ureidoimidazoline decarboxylase